MASTYATFSNSYARLPQHFYSRLNPTPVPQPRLVAFNEALAQELGIDTGAVDTTVLAAIHGGNLVPPGAEPIAMAYAGHQFGGFVPQLGDGRAILLGEVLDRQGRRRDIQLKGSGRTPYSRRGDGRAALGPVLREYLVSEAMHALGVPTTRSLAAVLSGEFVVREQRLPGAIFTRVAASHIRVGTFQFLSARGEDASIRLLAQYAIERHYPDTGADQRPALALLQEASRRQAELVARWMMVGFVHGVMNTDNTAISGETIDFGPCAFLEAYDPETVFSSIDSHGRYAFGNQPQAARWNIARLAETLVPVIDPDTGRATELAQAVIDEFPAHFERAWIGGMRAKLGLALEEEGDFDLANGLLECMRLNQADFTLTFRRLCDAAADPAGAIGPREQFADPGAYDAWAQKWHQRLQREPATRQERAARMRRCNPAFIPRNHRVEQAIEAATQHGDTTRFLDLLRVVANPYDEQPESADLRNAAQPAERVLRTFCGT